MGSRKYNATKVRFETAQGELVTFDSLTEMQVYRNLRPICTAMGIKIHPHYPILIKPESPRFKPRHYIVDFMLTCHRFNDLLIEVKSWPTITDDFILKLEMMDHFDPSLMSDYVIALVNGSKIVQRRGKNTTLAELAQKRCKCNVIDVTQLPYWVSMNFS
ncbi:MAG: hypothetical protein Fur0042_12650 [Cyanophyceae cyanobacterium]